MDLKNLRYFAEVTRHGGFLQASLQIHVSQPALSKAIQQLEEELGAVLLVRSRPGIPARLTPAGELVLHHARALLERSAQLREEVDRLNHLTSGVLRIGLPPLGSIEFIATVLTEFRNRFPRVQLQLLEQGGAELENAVRKGELELALSLRPQDQALDYTLLCEEPLVVALPLSHPLASRNEITPQDLEEQPWIQLEGASLLNRMLQEQIPRWRSTAPDITQSGNQDFCLSLVAAGAGLMVLPRLLAQHHIPPGVKTVPLTGSGLRWQLGIIWRKDAPLSVAAQKWMELTSTIERK